MGRPATTEAMPLDNTGIAFSLGCPDYIHIVPGLEGIYPQFLTEFETADIPSQFTEDAEKSLVRLPEMPLQGLGYVLLLDPATPDLDCIISFSRYGLFLNDNSRFNFDNRRRHRRAVFGKNLRHTQLSANKSLSHLASLIA
jgi:hypothetical protein